MNALPGADPVSRRDIYAADLAWLDRLLEREVLRLRARYELSLDELRGLYVSDAQVDALLDTRNGVDVIGTLDGQAQALAAARRLDTPLIELASRCGLSRFEKDVMLCALAPEIDLRYETLYAYLNNDVSRRHVTVDLALRLFAPAQREYRALLDPGARLFTSGILDAFDTGAEHRAGLAAGFALSPLATQYLLELPLADPRLPATLRVADPRTRDAEIALLAASARAAVEHWAACLNRWPPLVVLHGEGVAEQAAAARFAAERHGLATLPLPLAMIADSASWAAAWPRVRLLSRLARAVIVLRGDAGLLREPHAGEHLTRALREMLDDGVLVAWACGSDAAWTTRVADLPHVALALPSPDARERANAWTTAGRDYGVDAPATLSADLGARFVLPVSRIRAAMASASCVASDGDQLCSALAQAAKNQSAQGLDVVATRVRSAHRWSDLVLPPATAGALGEFAAAIAQRETVYRDWGMDARSGRGLLALFAGASGTGKSMAAGVVANEAGLDLFRIDLAAVVSKYIGETEKNLDRIFNAARDSNAVLFFDEADALLGKRAEVKDAHDRYANIEVSYLLQKMEEHTGVVVLATNLAKNIDQAFARRMHYVVEFPRPDADLRERLWRGMFPAAAPVAADVDFRYLAEQFETSGGEIRTVALEAAFLASANGCAIGMVQLLHALTRLELKQGHPAGGNRTRQFYARSGRGAEA